MYRFSPQILDVISTTNTLSDFTGNGQESLVKKTLNQKKNINNRLFYCLGQWPTVGFFLFIHCHKSPNFFA